MTTQIQTVLFTDTTHFLQARIDVRMPGLPLDAAERIAHAAHDVCPSSKAVHGNIDVVTNVDATAAALVA